MNKISIKIAIVLAMINLIAVFYLNFSGQLSIFSQFVVIPWLAIQSLTIIAMMIPKPHRAGKC